MHRGLLAGIHETYNNELCHFVADNCRANIIVVKNQEQVDKILKVIYHVRTWCGDEVNRELCIELASQLAFALHCSYYVRPFLSSTGQRQTQAPSPESCCAVQRKTQQELPYPGVPQCVWGNICLTSATQGGLAHTFNLCCCCDACKITS